MRAAGPWRAAGRSRGEYGARRAAGPLAVAVLVSLIPVAAFTVTVAGVEARRPGAVRAADPHAIVGPVAPVVVRRAGEGAGKTADGPRIGVLTYNVCAANNRDNTCARDLTPARRKVWADRVADLVKSRNAAVASFTEMCYAQVHLLRRKLPDHRLVWHGIAKGGGDRCRRLWGGLTSKTTPRTASASGWRWR